jgi:hypothetical protein
MSESAARCRAAVAVAALGIAALGVAAGPVRAEAHSDPAPPPSQWPATPAATARVEGAAHAVRFWGPDRFQTSLALSLALRGQGGFPFDTPDRTSAGAGSLGGASQWWGVGTCPRAVIVVAGDSAADALAASALSDPTDQSSEPFLQRTAAADPLFDPVGGFARVDTDSAPILATRSARSGATQLAPATRVAAQDLRSGGCTTARQAIVVGGTAAVPAGVDAELISIGYDEVFRVQGATRYATAANLARSLGTAARPSGTTACADPNAADGNAQMAFVANSVVEYRESATSCELLDRTVVLTDGVTGADALAAGWWTSFWQVPVLLHNGSADALPTATADALATLDVDHLIVLGGTGRISADVVDEAVALTGARVIRVEGEDRYQTSVAMARQFGGWWPTGRGTDYAGSMVCLAASSGEGDAARGWPDALAAGPWCGALNGAAANPGAPARALAPTTGAQPTTTPVGVRPAHDAVPILLVPFGAQVLPDAVATLLTESFELSDNWCTGVTASPACLTPGFAVVFGGAGAIGEGALEQASRLVSGSSTLETGTLPAQLDGWFHTDLDLAPVYAMNGTGTSAVCAPRNGVRRARWLTVFGTPQAARALNSADVLMTGRYLTDADGVERSRSLSAPVCTTYNPAGRSEVATRAVGLAGRASAVQVLQIAPANRFALLGPLVSSSPQSASGTDSDTDLSAGGPTLRSFVTSSPVPAVGISSKGQPTTVSSATVSITLVRGTDTATSRGPDVFDASWSLVTPLGTVTGTASGEAILIAGAWQLRGASTVTGGTWNLSRGVGGFSATLTTNTPGDATDDALSWQVDALVTS